jgi:SSS family solute:Na+ symporter
MVVFVIAELTAVGGVTAILTGVDGRVTVVAVAVVTLAYTAYGGLRASLRTDSWQAWMIVALLGTGALAVFVDTRAPADALRDSGLLKVERVGLEVALTLIIAVLAANMFHQGYWQRVWAARDQRSLDRGALLGSAVVIPIVLVVGVMGVLAAGRGLDLGSPPVPFFALLAGLPAWVGALVLALGVSLVASSVDTLENALASVIAVERPAMPLAAARVVTVVLMVPAIVVAVQGYSVLRLFLIADLLCAATVVPALMGLWARATAAGALAGAVAGLAGAVVPGSLSTGSLWEGVRLATFPDAVPTLAPFLWAVIASSVVAVAVSLAGGKTADINSIDARVPALGRRES